jgi:hypothetical protein
MVIIYIINMLYEPFKLNILRKRFEKSNPDLEKMVRIRITATNIKGRYTES